MQDQPHPIIDPQSLNEVSAHSGINPNRIGVNRLPKTQSRATKEIEQATQLPGPQSMTLPASPPLSSPDSPNQLPNIRINQGADTGLIANPWLEIAKHSGLSVAPSNEPTTSPEKPPGGRS
ncbi:hypothetical protein [Polynucleobacter sp. MWH-Tro8-2-5-gr]|nr:hypothetical protein [Polynucleobacter sp. MWH-Tro8-2-5-gr]